MVSLVNDTTSEEYEQNYKNFDFKNQISDYENNPLYGKNALSHICKYYEENDCLYKFSNIDHKTFSVISLNIRSLPGKFEELKNFLDSSFGFFKPSVICIQEVWNKPIYEDFHLENYHNLQYKIRDMSGLNSNAGGGVGIYIHNSYTFEHIPELSIFIPRVFESQFFKVKIEKNKFIIIANIYRPNTAPFADLKKCNVLLKETIENIQTNPNFKYAKDIIFCGDLNIDLLKYETHPETGAYVDTLFQNGLLPLITLPTRIENRKASIIDHISTNIIDDNYDTGIIISDISDHFPVFYVKHFDNKYDLDSKRKIRKITSNNKEIFKSKLENLNWDNVMYNQDPMSACDNFFNNITKAYENSFPEKIISLSKKSLFKSPWMTAGLLSSRKKKQKLYCKKTRKPTVDNIKTFKNYNSIYTRTIRKAREQYYNDTFQSLSNDCKKTWQTINGILGRKKDTNDIPETFISNGKILSGSYEIAEGFNNFFAEIGPKLAKNIPKSKKHFSEYLSDPCAENFVFANINHEIVNEALGKLKNKNSCGPDNISTNLLKAISSTIMAPLSHILNLSFKTGYIPSCMKTAVIKPIFKKGKPDEFTNYRPISLLSSFSKLLEKIAANQMMKFLNKFKILYEHQYGFRSGYNTTQPVIHFIDKIFKALNNPDENQVSLAIFIDLTKAFDTCDINILLHKLEHYGFRGISNIWFKNYLTGRYQYTNIRGVNSSLKEMSCGVPQGSILGPILFILLINDLPNASKLFSILYADDTTLIKSGSNISQLFEEANIELNKLADWFKANMLTLNTSKTKYILFRHKSLAVNFSNITLKIENETIDRIGAGCQEESFKFVGIHLDEFLSWEVHSRKIRTKISGAVYALSKLKNLLPKKIKYLIYNSLF